MRDSGAIRTEADAVRDLAELDRYDVGRLILNQGMRPEEVTVLAKADVGLESAQIHVRRGKSPAARRTLDMTSETRSILALRLQGDSQWLFPSWHKPGEPIGRLNQAHDRLVETALKENIASITTSAMLRYDLVLKEIDKTTQPQWKGKSI